MKTLRSLCLRSGFSLAVLCSGCGYFDDSSFIVRNHSSHAISAVSILAPGQVVTAGQIDPGHQAEVHLRAERDGEYILLFTRERRSERHSLEYATPNLPVACVVTISESSANAECRAGTLR